MVDNEMGVLKIEREVREEACVERLRLKVKTESCLVQVGTREVRAQGH